ncbi:transglutaminase superfamily protein [Maricaulis maris]|uniref:Transglutaminase superfamily protein n=1 Tax=Maricaulis maris TaxID=74318 RepID=A0A495D425_9PROT|nr:transglutaminase superfamily protein [Maricaulis maris]
MLLRVFIGAVLALVSSISALWLYGQIRPSETAQSNPALTEPIRFAPSVEPEITFQPRPDFVRVVDVPSPDEVDKPAQNGLRPVLFDYQSQARARSMAHYYRQVFDATTQAGATGLSQVFIPFDPTTQTVALHSVLLLRGEEALDVTREVRVEFVRPDGAVQTRIFNGSVTGLVRVPGTRSGDRLDVEYSITDHSTVTGFRHSQVINLGPPVDQFMQVHLRSAWRGDPPQHVTFGGAPEMTEIREGDYSVLEFGPDVLPATETEFLTPHWRFPHPLFLASQFESWHEVASWGERFYRPVEDPLIAELAQTIQAEHEDDEARILAALRHVQNEISYFAILLGEGGYRPVHPAETLRFSEGDCKAKALLLISLLDAMGIEARAAFVHTETGRGIDKLPPTPFAFNHVIVEVSHGNRRHLVDPTDIERSGGLREQARQDWGFALVADAGRGALERISIRPSRMPLADIDEQYSITSAERDDHRAVLRTCWTYRGEMADAIRQEIRMNGMDAALASYERFYASRSDDLTIIGGAELADDPETGHLIYTAEMQVDLFDFSHPDSEMPSYIFIAHGASRAILGAPLEARENPLALPYPYDFRHRITLNLPEGSSHWIPDDPSYRQYMNDMTVENDAFELTDSRDFTENRVVLTARTRILEPEILPDLFTRVENDLQGSDPMSYVVIGEQINMQVDPGRMQNLLIPSHAPALPEYTTIR